MSITQNLENNYKNIVKSIKNMKNGIERDYAIGSLIVDLGNRSIAAVCKALGICYRKAKSCLELFITGEKHTKPEARGRKHITEKYPNIIEDIEKVIEKYKNVDPSFKTETLNISVSPKTIINELIEKYNYPKDFACYNTINSLLKKMGYKLHRIPKTKVLHKIPETDAIFENVNEEMASALESDESTLAISIDDKATKKIGNLSDNGKTYLDEKADDHDTHYDYSVKPFGILDLKTNETYVTCTPYNSTAEFKVYCIENYLEIKEKEREIKKLIIFLDNGPENSGRRKLWLKSLVKLAIKHKIVIKLVYYPPYHSKYNKIERYWARLQMDWNRVIINSLQLLIAVINKVSWCGVKTIGTLCTKKYDKGIKVSDYEMETEVDPHIIREEGLEKWSIVVTPF